MKSKQTQELLIVFTRYPVPGTTKTRLAEVLGDEGAAEMQKKLTEHTLAQVRQYLQLRSAAVAVYYEGGRPDLMQEWLGPDYHYQDQGKGDLGQRMEKAFAAAFKRGYKRTVIIGADCPALHARNLLEAFEVLLHNELVLGPASDGGYYLIGLSRHEKSIFSQIPWSTDTVLAKTLGIALQKGLSVELLSTLSDVDRPEDLKHFDLPAAESGKSSGAGKGQLSGVPAINAVPSRKNTRCISSIIIPARNEAESLTGLLPELLSIPGIEVLVVDGGSSDDTVDTAKSLGAKVFRVPPGRALQMNAGARAARGDILIFLHGDTRLPPGFMTHVRDTLSQPGIAAGAFRLAIDGKGIGLRIIEWLANFRARILQFPYGDQAIFLTAQMFSSVHGFPHLPIMEDFELVRQLKRKGRLKILSLAATTSPRRWEKLGLLRTTVLNQAIIMGYLLGVDPEKLAKWYRGREGKKRG